MDRFEEMATFVRIVEAGSISTAADQLNLVKSAVSRRLADLESRLGVQLVVRTTRRLNLTENGQQYFNHCLRILSEVDEAEQEVMHGDVALTGSIRLAAPLSFGLTHLSPALNDFLNQHPELKLDLDLNDRTLNLMEENVDLAIRIGRLADSSLVARKLASVQMIVCASPEYLETHGEPQQPKDLEYHASLIYSYVAPQEWFFKKGNEPEIAIRSNCRMRANNGDVLLKAAIAGLGVLQTPSFISTDAIKQGLLVPILTDYMPGKGTIYIIYPKQRYLPQRTRVLIDYLIDYFHSNPID